MDLGNWLKSAMTVIYKSTFLVLGLQLLIGCILTTPSWAINDAVIRPTNTTAVRLVSTDTTKKLISSDQTDWLAGTANEVEVNDDGDGTATAGLPDNVTITSDLAVGGEITTVDAITFDDPPVDTIAEREIRWNTDIYAFDVGVDSSGNSAAIGQSMYRYAQNAPAYSTTIPAGSAVYTYDRTGLNPVVRMARSDSPSTSSILGVTQIEMLSPSYGTVVTGGTLYFQKTDYTGSGVWGTTWATGDPLYVSKTVAGQLTNVEPSAPHHSDIVGFVGIVHANIGTIDVKINRHKTMEELSDVNGTALTTTGQLPVWDNAAGYFDFNYNLTDYLQLAGGTITGSLTINTDLTVDGDTYTSLTAGSIPYIGASGLLTEDNSNLFYDGNLGVGTNSPLATTKATISGSVTSTGDNAIGLSVETELVAAKDNDILRGLSISPTINSGGFASPLLYAVDIDASLNGLARMVFSNTDTGTLAQVGVQITNDVGNTTISLYGSNYTSATLRNVLYFKNGVGGMKYVANTGSTIGFGIGTASSDATDITINSDSTVSIPSTLYSGAANNMSFGFDGSDGYCNSENVTANDEFHFTNWDYVSVVGAFKAGDGTNELNVASDGSPTLVGTAHIPYGSMYGDDMAVTVTVSVAGTYYEIGSGISDGGSSGITFQNSKELKVVTAGNYVVNWSDTVETGSANQYIESTVMVNGTEQLNCVNASEVPTANKEASLGGTCVLDLAVNDLVSLAVDNETSTANITVNHANLTIFQVGGT